MMNSVSFIPSPIWFMHLYLIFLLLLNVVDVGVFHTGAVKPAFFIIGLFSIILLRPEILPQPIIFIYGLFCDTLSGMSFGFFASLGLLLWVIIDSGRRYIKGQSWHVVWSSFILCYAVLLIFEIFIFAVIGDTPLDEVQIAGKLVLTMISFPLCFMPFLWIDRWAKQKEV
jgi:hypothetical protein